MTISHMTVIQWICVIVIGIAISAIGAYIQSELAFRRRQNQIEKILNILIREATRKE